MIGGRINLRHDESFIALCTGGVGVKVLANRRPLNSCTLMINLTLP